jgi:tetratricopeptide (TPR) repeat protein
MSRDVRGLEVTGAGAEAVAVYDAAVEQLLAFRGDPIAGVESALELAPHAPLLHATRAALALLGTDRQYLADARSSVAKARLQVAGATERERWHVEAVSAWAEGRLEDAAEAWEQALLVAPRDVLALLCAHQADFFLGWSSTLRDRVARVLPDWDASTPGYGYVLGMYSFGLEESGDYGRAEETGLRSVELNPQDAWGVHAIAHTYEMQGRQQDGITWLSTRSADWADDNFFAVHNWWHLALFHLDLLQLDQVLRLFDERIRVARSDAMLDLLDASALLWRLMLGGHDTGGRWTTLAEDWQRFVDDGWYGFNDVHAMQAFAAMGDEASAKRLLAALERASGESTTNARMVREVALPEAQALWAFGTGDYARVLDLLLPLRPHLARAGGSNAQRDLVFQTVIEAALRAGRTRLGTALLQERVAMKPTSPHNWHWLARARDEAGDDTGAQTARSRAAALLR